MGGAKTIAWEISVAAASAPVLSPVCVEKGKRGPGRASIGPASSAPLQRKLMTFPKAI